MAYRHLGLVLLACALFGVLARSSLPTDPSRVAAGPTQKVAESTAPLSIDGVRLGMRRDEVDALLGTPTQSVIRVRAGEKVAWTYATRRDGRRQETSIGYTDDRVTTIAGNTLAYDRVHLSIGDVCPIVDESGKTVIATSTGRTRVDLGDAHVITKDGRIEVLWAGGPFPDL